VLTGLGDNPYNRKLARDKALEVERDIAYGEFNPEKLSEYKPSPVSTMADSDTSISVVLKR
jgi:hypothetical protein